MIVMSWIFLIPFAVVSLFFLNKLFTQTIRVNIIFCIWGLFVSLAVVGTSAGVIWGGLLK